MANSKPADTATDVARGALLSPTNAVLASGCTQFLTIYICAQAETQLFVQMTGSTAAAGMLLAKTMSLSGARLRPCLLRDTMMMLLPRCHQPVASACACITLLSLLHRTREISYCCICNPGRF